ncbi:MAG: TlpA family protein disulfide reductase [Gammaproteobacteria bacterium]
MPLKKLFSCLLLPFLVCLNAPAQADSSAFTSGSYQQILADNADQPFMLVIWSVNCSSCLKDMALLNNIHKSRPDLKIIMLAADELSVTEQIQQILEKNQLSDIENWVYAEDNTQKLQYEIDPKWYGELPRTYFFDKAHQRTGVSGVLSKEDYETMFAKILK